MDKSILQRFAIWARTELISQVAQRAYQYGIDQNGYGDADAVTVGGRALNADEQRQRRELVEQIRHKGYSQVMEEVAYTWFSGKRKCDILREYDIASSLLDRWIQQGETTGSFKEKDNRTPEQQELIELRKRNKQLEMENDILKQAALIMGRGLM